MGKTIHVKGCIKWRHKQNLLQEAGIIKNDLPQDYIKLKQSLKSKINHLEQKYDAEKNKVRKLAILEIIEIYKSIMGE